MMCRPTRLHNTASSQARRYSVLILALLVVFASRIGYCALSGRLGEAAAGEHHEYCIAAERLLEHGVFASPLVLDEDCIIPSAHLPPLYVWLVAAVYWTCGVGTPLAFAVLHVLNAMAAAGGALCVFIVASRLAGAMAAWFAIAIYAVNPVLIGFTDYVWDTSFAATAVAISVWLSFRLSQGPPRHRHWFLLGCWLGVVALLSPALTAGYPFLVLWPLITRHGRRFRPIIRGVALVLLGWLLLITPWTVRNLAQFDRWMYVRGGLGMEVWLGVCPEAEEDGGVVFQKRYPLRADPEQAKLCSDGEGDYYAECWTQAAAAIKQDPWRFLRLSGARAVDFWFGTILTHVPEGVSGWPAEFTRKGVTLFVTAEFVLILVCVCLRRQLTHEAAWLIAIALALSLPFLLTHVFVRYRAPIEPVMAVLIALVAYPRPSSLRDNAHPEN